MGCDRIIAGFNLLLEYQAAEIANSNRLLELANELQTFIQNNTWIPDDKMYHTFLIDSNNKIVLVGDPRRYESLMVLFENIISGAVSGA